MTRAALVGPLAVLVAVLGGCGSTNDSDAAGAGGAPGGAGGTDATSGGGTSTGTSGGAGGTGGAESCPPCVPPPSNECVGSGPCGCGPYTCPDDDTGEQCGPVVCAEGMECCNPLQGTCVKPGMVCAQ